jgi:hypothetical protein
MKQKANQASDDRVVQSYVLQVSAGPEFAGDLLRVQTLDDLRDPAADRRTRERQRPPDVDLELDRALVKRVPTAICQSFSFRWTPDPRRSRRQAAETPRRSRIESRTGHRPDRQSRFQHIAPQTENGSRPHHVALDWRNMPGLIAKLRQIDPVAARCLEFLLLTATRSGEA